MFSAKKSVDFMLCKIGNKIVMVRQKVVSFDCTFLLLICLKLASPSTSGPLEYIGTVEICPKHFFAEICFHSSVFWRKVGIVIVLHLFNGIDYIEVTGSNKI